MPVPSAAVTTESHALSQYKSFQGVLLGRYLINQLAASSFSTVSKVIATILNSQESPYFCIA
jgi:hypothetical protein